MRLVFIIQPRDLDIHALLHDLFHQSFVYLKGWNLKYEN
jgi:hypothetical protein